MNGRLGGKKTAAVLGGGSWGTALAHLMGVSGAEVVLWMRNPERVKEINEQHTNTRYLRDRKLHENVRATEDLREAASW